MKKKSKENVLAFGEVTGHTHKVDVDVLEEGNLKFFEGETKVVHEEHKIIQLPCKKWVSGIVNEFDYFQEMEKKIVD